MSNGFTASSLFLNTKLYNKLNYTIENVGDIFSILVDPHSSHQFDCFCINCDKESTFKTNPESHTVHTLHQEHDLTKWRILQNSETALNTTFYCQRNSEHFYEMSFFVTDDYITKIGQYPSMASIDTNEIKKYKKVLSKDFNDFSKAIGLVSHGIGIGSFVYLRRIFENLIEEKHNQRKNSSDWDESKYQKSKMDEKIKMLADTLPTILVTNRKLYSIISKGIHELSEDECLKLFPNVRLAIELILDEKIHMIEREAKIKSIENFVSDTVDKIK